MNFPALLVVLSIPLFLWGALFCFRIKSIKLIFSTVFVSVFGMIYMFSIQWSENFDLQLAFWMLSSLLMMFFVCRAYYLSMSAASVRQVVNEMSLTHQEERKVWHHWLNSSDRALEESRVEIKNLNYAREAFLTNITSKMLKQIRTSTGFLDIVLDSELQADQRTCINSISSSLEELMLTVSDVHNISRSESADFSLRRNIFSLQSCLDGLFLRYKDVMERKSLNFSVFVDENVPETVIGDSGCITQALMHLTENAYRYTPSGAIDVHVSLDRFNENNEALLLFEVSDTGIGISKEKENELQKLFSDRSSDHSLSYTNLDLVVVQKIVNLLQGWCGFENIEGEGARFWFRVSLEVSSSVESFVSLDLKNSKILLVCHDEALVEDVERFENLEVGDFLISKQMSDVETKLEEGGVDMVIFLCAEVGVDVFETVSRYRKNETVVNKALPILVFTNLYDSNIFQTCIKSGVDDCIALGQCESYFIQRQIRKWLS